MGGRLSPRLRLGATVAVAAALALSASACGGAQAGGDDGKVTITVATVDNPQMQDIENLSGEFEKEHPEINLDFVILPENEVRDQVTRDITTQSGKYDVVTIGTYEAPVWAKRGWLTQLDTYAGEDDYAVDDIIRPMRQALSHRGGLYAVPFYGESSFLMYRKDLFAKAGLTMPKRPTWQQIADFAATLNDPENGVAGICLRGLPGWGEVLCPLNTLINTFGGRWYDNDWKPHLTDPETEKAVKFYVDLVRGYGEPGAPSAGYTQCLAAFSQGKAAMWYDATVGASSLEDPKTSQVAGKVGYAKAPVVKTRESGWQWAWALAMPNTSKHKDAAWEFMSWATSKDYIKLVGNRLGWSRVPPGTRLSTYELPEYRKAAAGFADLTLDTIKSVNPKHPGVHPQPWVGVQVITIPEFQELGNKASQEITAAIAGRQSVKEALAKAQRYAEEAAPRRK